MIRYFLGRLRSRGTEFRPRSLRRFSSALCTVVSIAILTTGCASLTPAGDAEIAWQALNVVDAGQTVTIARNPAGMYEQRAQFALGRHPNEKDVYVFLAAYGLIHLGVSRWLDYEDQEHPDGYWNYALGIWECATLAEKGFNVTNNARLGIEPWGSARQ